MGLKSLVTRAILVLGLICSLAATGDDCKVKKPETADNVRIVDIGLERATLLFEQNIQKPSVDKFLLDISTLQDPAFDIKRVLVILNSDGGNVKEGLRMAVAIESYPGVVDCLVTKSASSMAFLVLQACTNRFMTPNATLMTHEPYVGEITAATKYDLFSHFFLLTQTSEMMADIISTRMHMPVEAYLQKIKHQDWVMGARDAMVWDAVDAVVPITRPPMVPWVPVP
jgi:ATP-dependent protease ClpP protease subunit